MAKEISALGLQVVPPEAVVSRHYLQSVETLADIGLRAERCRPPVRVGLMKCVKAKAAVR
jgi:hypothetical protein